MFDLGDAGFYVREAVKLSGARFSILLLGKNKISLAKNSFLNYSPKLSNYKYRRLRVDISYIISHFGGTPYKGLDKSLSPRKEIVEMLKDVPVTVKRNKEKKVKTLNYELFKKDVEEKVLEIKETMKNPEKRKDPDLKFLLSEANYCLEGIKKVESGNHKRRKNRLSSFEKSISKIAKDKYIETKSYWESFPKLNKALCEKEEANLEGKTGGRILDPKVKKSYLESLFGDYSDEKRKIKKLIEQKKSREEKNLLIDFKRLEEKYMAPIMNTCKTLKKAKNPEAEINKIRSKISKKDNFSEEHKEFLNSMGAEVNEISKDVFVKRVEEKMILLQNRFDLLNTINDKEGMDSSDIIDLNKQYCVGRSLRSVEEIILEREHKGKDITEIFEPPEIPKRHHLNKRMDKLERHKERGDLEMFNSGFLELPKDPKKFSLVKRKENDSKQKPPRKNKGERHKKKKVHFENFSKKVGYNFLRLTNSREGFYPKPVNQYPRKNKFADHRMIIKIIEGGEIYVKSRSGKTNLLENFSSDDGNGGQGGVNFKEFMEKYKSMMKPTVLEMTELNS